MKGYRGALDDPQMVAAVLSPTTRARTRGRLEWRQAKGSTRLDAFVAVETPGIGVLDAKLHVAASPMRPEKITLAYVIDGGAVRRLCVNAPHPPFRGTHKHRFENIGAGECYEPDDIPELALHPRDALRGYRGVFEAFASECNVRIGADLAWSDPWEA